MVQGRRQDDSKIDELIRLVSAQSILIDQVHKAMFGTNGNLGMKAEWEQHKGGMKVFKLLAGGSGVIGLILGVIKILEGIK